MKISYNWLKDYINIDLPIDTLTDILTNIGLEVSKVESFSSIKGGMKGLIIGRVVSCGKHPNADRLSLTQVDIGEETLLSIICGASNVAENKKVVVAPVGTKLYKKEDSFILKKTKIRGEVSEGMICSEAEIGLGDDEEGILLLADEAKIGTPAKDYFQVTEDTVIEIDLTPNRIDAASHIGVARDVAAFLNQTKHIRYQKPSVAEFRIDEKTDPLTIEVQNTKACPRYAGLCLKNISVEPSPAWLQNKLKAIGLNPINNVVDITNYVLFETGQPLHAFDREMIKGDRVVVKTFSDNTKFTTLDGIERTLHKDDLMICDAVSPLCMAGVLGGIDSGVTENTTSLFLESACFDPVYNRKSARRHSLPTDASFRFERGIDINQITYALKRAGMLLKELAGATISSEIIDIYPMPVQNSVINLKFSYVEKLVGHHIPKKILKNILESLEINLLEETSKSLIIEIPSYRVDVTRPADVVEEILRLYGYNNIPLKHKLNAHLNISDEKNDFPEEKKIADYLSHQGFLEIINNSLVGATHLNLIGYPIGNIVMINNPLSKELNTLRQTLLIGGLENISHNQNRQFKNLQFYEFGNVYRAKLNISNMKSVDDYEEEKLLGIFLTGNEYVKNWHKSEKPMDFFLLKAHVHNVLRLVGIPMKAIKTAVTENTMFSEGVSYAFANTLVANFGLIKNHITANFSIETSVYYAEIYWEKLLQRQSAKNIVTSQLPKYPYVVRDLSLLLKKDIPYQKLEDAAFKTLPNVLKEVSLFDVYEGKGMGKDEKSYAINFLFLDERKTLTDRRIDVMMQKLINVFTKEFQAIIR